MKKVMQIILIIILTVVVVFPQQGKYQRKSVSSVESVWFKSDALQKGIKFDYEFFDKIVDFYIEVERFDYNVLPENLLTDFRKQANELETITSDKLGELLENTIGKKILEILNSPDVKKNRGLMLKDESAFQSFAATKAKSLGLTENELAMLMNSAYIYLPFITSMKEKIEDKNITVTIKGGILWYNLKVDKNTGDISILKLISATTSGIGLATKGDKDYNKFKFGSEVFKTTPKIYAQYDATLAWVKNLGVKTKEIDAFKLTAQIVEAIGRKYSFSLGAKEGVHLDDGFHLIEIEEDASGDEISRKVGFIRVTKTGQNKNDPTAYSKAMQLLGRKVDIGTIVHEHPRLGIDTRFKMGMISGMNIEADHTYNAFVGGNILDEDATSAFGANLSFAYNLAPIVGITQTFLDIDIGAGVPLAKYNEDVDGSAFLLAIYTGLTKKIWFGGSNLGVNAWCGYDMLSMPFEVSDEKYSYNVSALGAKFGAVYEYLFNPDLSFNVGLGYKLGFAPSLVEITDKDGDTVWEGDEADFEDMKLGGITFTAGINYSLGELPINIFGFLDPFKKY